MELVLFTVIAFVLGVILGLALVPTKVVTEYITSEKKDPKYLLTWKRGRMRSDDSRVISNQIEALRADNQPFSCWVDGKQIHPKQR